MEILSTGEKIKRARVYKGITLKELCGDKISISKMSCIENGKIKAEKEVLEYISLKLSLDLDYLLKDVREQLVDNIASIKKNIFSGDGIEEKIKYNLEFANEYKYFDLAFELMHLLFKCYLEEARYENIQLIVSQYYFLSQKNIDKEFVTKYFYDMGKYFFQNKEYTQAITYYERLEKILKDNKLKDKGEYSNTLFNKALSYYKLKKIINSYEDMQEAEKYIGYVEDSIIKGRMYNLLANLCIKLKKPEAENFVKKAYEFQKHNPISLALSKESYAECYFEIGEKANAVKEIKEGLIIFPKHNKLKYVEFMNNCIKLFIDYKEYEEAYSICDEALNLAIDCDHIKLIERSYYLKGIILQKQGKIAEAEMYMNLSLDAILKFGSRAERYERYMDIAHMYHKLGETSDSLKFFSAALQLEKDL